MPILLRPTILAALLLLAATAPGAQTLRDRLQQGVEGGAAVVQQGVQGGVSVVQQGAAAAQRKAEATANRIEAGVDSTVDLMADEPTVEATRDKIDLMAGQAIERLLRERPEVDPLFQSSAGYAVFDTRKLTVAGVGGGVGRGVAVSTTDDSRTYMKLSTASVGIGFGGRSLESQMVILFADDATFRAFTTDGWDATAEGGIGQNTTNVGLSYVDGRIVFLLTTEGWRVSATAAGTQYQLDQALN